MLFTFLVELLGHFLFKHFFVNAETMLSILHVGLNLALVELCGGLCFRDSLRAVDGNLGSTHNQVLLSSYRR